MCMACVWHVCAQDLLHDMSIGRKFTYGHHVALQFMLEKQRSGRAPTSPAAPSCLAPSLRPFSLAVRSPALALSRLLRRSELFKLITECPEFKVSRVNLARLYLNTEKDKYGVLEGDLTCISLASHLHPGCIHTGAHPQPRALLLRRGALMIP